jgi:ATP-binding protein involved in chromosome partitioning
MMGVTESRPRVAEDGGSMLPFDAHGVKVMSLGFILEVDTPVIWRGPMVMKAIEQLLGDVDWGALDFMVIDLPPGTGDAQLTLTQKVPLSGAVIVTTPQDVALIDARKGLAMFRKVGVPVLGIVENMSSFVCPHCGEATDIFKKGGGERTAQELECAFLGNIPLDPAIAIAGDEGLPIVVRARRQSRRLLSGDCSGRRRSVRRGDPSGLDPIVVCVVSDEDDSLAGHCGIRAGRHRLRRSLGRSRG